MEDNEEKLESAERQTILTSEPERNPKRIFIPIAVILTLILGTLIAIKASVQKETRLAFQRIELIEGAELPNLSLTYLDGKKTMLADLPHKVTMINFWATWCEACLEEMPSIVSLRNQFSSQGFEVLGVNVDEDPERVAPGMVQKFNMPFPILTDKNGELAQMFDVHAIPLTVIISKNRKILFVESGGREWNTEDIQQMMKNWLK